MHLKSAAFCLSTAALLSSVAASPSVLRVAAPKTSKRQVQEITGELGCTAKGPLAGPWAVELFTCVTDSNYTCQATEMTGCTAGDATNIETLMVFDSTKGTALSGAASIAEAYFKCPENGLVQCAIHFANNGSEAGSYGLRIMNATEETPFLNATFGAPSDDNTTETDSLSGTDSLDGEPTDSDSSFDEPTDTSSDEFGSPTDSSSDEFGSPTDSSGGFGGPSETEGGSSGGPSETDTSAAGSPTGDTFDSQVMGSDVPVATSGSFSTSTSGFDSVPTDELSGFS